MKIVRLASLTLIMIAGIIKVSAQSADDIINKWTAAMGGKEKLESIKTIYTEGDLNIMSNSAPHKTYLVNGAGFKSVTDFNGQQIIDCYTKDSGWSVNPLAGVSTPTDMPAAQVKLGQSQLQTAGPLFNYAAKGSKVELQGKDNVNGSATYKLKLTDAAGLEITYYIDTASNYILKEVKKINTDGQDVEISTVNSDYRKVADGYVMPYSQELTLPGFSLTITHKTIEINKDIDPAVFQKPKS
jgi:hypothetical protein